MSCTSADCNRRDLVQYIAHAKLPRENIIRIFLTTLSQSKCQQNISKIRQRPIAQVIKQLYSQTLIEATRKIQSLVGLQTILLVSRFYYKIISSLYFIRNLFEIRQA